jgi:hypothetical protein
MEVISSLLGISVWRPPISLLGSAGRPCTASLTPDNTTSAVTSPPLTWQALAVVPY